MPPDTNITRPSVPSLLSDMHMQTSLFFALLSSSLLSFANGAAVDVRSTLDIFSPRIISPDATTTWVAGHVETVTWDTSNAPVNISNGAAVDLETTEKPPSFHVRLISGFNLRSGSVDVPVPNVAPGDYRIILFGDSGNVSPVFKIVSA